MEKLKSIPGVEFGTSQKPGFGCGIGLVNFPGHKLADMEIFLWSNYRLLTSTIEHENIRGLRITPNVYTTTKQLDVLIEGVRDFLKTKA
jgi:selenocysteine lyase/cysteine desulfurase